MSNFRKWCECSDRDDIEPPSHTAVMQPCTKWFAQRSVSLRCLTHRACRRVAEQHQHVPQLYLAGSLRSWRALLARASQPRNTLAHHFIMGRIGLAEADDVRVSVLPVVVSAHTAHGVFDIIKKSLACKDQNPSPQPTIGCRSSPCRALAATIWLGVAVVIGGT